MRQYRSRHRLSRKGRGVAGLALGALLSVSFAATPSHAAEEKLNEGLVHHFALDETSGTTLVNSGSAGSAANATLVNPEKATLTGDGVRFNPGSYASALDGAYVALPKNITTGMSNLTVDYDVWIDPANVGEHQMWGFGAKSGSCDVDTGAQGSIFASNTQRFRVAVGSANLQQNRVRMTEGAWTHVTYTQSRNANGTSWTGTLYLDGVQHATSTNLTTPPSVNAAGTNCNFLARSQTAGNYSFRGTIRDFRVYDRAVSLDETLALAKKTVANGVHADAAAIDLGLTSAIVRDIVLPKVGSVAGSAITWTSSDPSVVEVYTPPALASARKVAVTGKITRPAQGQPDATATLTATVRKGAQEVTTREIPIVVKAKFGDAQAVDRDAFDLTLYATGDVRGNINLPAGGEFGSTITWKSTTGLVTPTGEVTRPAFGRADVTATLTATITKGSASKTKSFPVTITAMPRSEKHERYFMGYFKGENLADGEQIMFATSNGNTALDWTGLTGGWPSLVSQLGDQGLRDPHIVRSPDGDTFYMIATDLNWYDQGGYAINDTQYIEVFESHDLVNWTPQRHVKVAPDNAGNAFAPESLWVEEIGAYAVFWAQSMWNDPVNRTGQGNAQMWYTTTRDFQTFSAPKVWQNPAPLSRIDTTAIRVGDHYYRVTKNEAGNQGSDIFSEKHTDFLDSNISNWTLLAPALGRTTWDANQGYEGPVIFKANPGDTSCPGQFYLWGDRYTNGGGYQAACHENIEAPTWNAKALTMTNAGVVRPRHGTVIPLTLREWNDIRGIPNSDVTTTTKVAVAPYASGAQTTTATATVEAADGFETGGQVRFSIGSWSELAHLKDGAATVTLPTGLPAGTRTVKAEYLGFDYLKASAGTASFTVPVAPELALTVTATARCVGTTAYVAVTAVNDAAVPANVTLTTPYGSKAVADVAQGKQAYQSFNTRAGQIATGSATVTATATIDGRQVTSTYDPSYTAINCA
ncbi:Ig-like domain repeat protein [Microbispora sp. NBC_01189]|uniref:immunoglobulin-like domain-containing protein n=1 Tax=Microbispora sp. NBC_01189 TaxID=2903583 RepID=UPI002E10D9A5|nr:Ig-like domain repeat protein [Microbispora sp. NBC_01189]